MIVERRPEVVLLDVHLPGGAYPCYKAVARELVILSGTVESHVSSVLRRLQLSNRAELTRWAAERRLI
jgi:hypothetical protein